MAKTDTSRWSNPEACSALNQQIPRPQIVSNRSNNRPINWGSANSRSPATKGISSRSPATMGVFSKKMDRKTMMRFNHSKNTLTASPATNGVSDHIRRRRLRKWVGVQQIRWRLLRFRAKG
ncbi:hypothetical protein Adt_13126 [Abeliophyllum distichum]|uniref:Uncharacterized protein n=1 Tax=Abeliophyllum distichum TaxID=126358 RepID=A0ABD1TVX1_9LAMI